MFDHENGHKHIQLITDVDKVVGASPLSSSVFFVKSDKLMDF